LRARRAKNASGLFVPARENDSWVGFAPRVDECAYFAALLRNRRFMRF
jgi:hypothetical protein